MIRFNNDYNHGAHNSIIQALQEINESSYAGYGDDEWCQKGADEIRKYLGTADVDIHFMVGGTPANITVITAALRPYESVICALNGHINYHEAGSIEHTGHKILSLPAKEGKLTAETIKQTASHYYDHGEAEFLTAPKLVFLSSPSEYGTVYSQKELLEIRKVCDQYHMYLYIDGARLGYWLSCSRCDVTLEDLARIADVFYIGGTKCGALFGEALVIVHKDLRDHFRTYMKQSGGILAKGWLLGVQFYTLFKDGLYFKLAKYANKLAAKLKQGFINASIPLYMDSPTNQIFVVITNELAEKLAKNFIYEFDHIVDEEHVCVRFCTSWSSSEDDIDQLIKSIS